MNQDSQGKQDDEDKTINLETNGGTYDVDIKTGSTNEALNVNSASQAFEEILISVGGYGKWQWKMLFICSFCGLFTAFHNFGAVFLAASPDHWCQIPDLNASFSETKEFKNFSSPLVTNKDGDLAPSKCQYYDLDYSKYDSFEDLKALEDERNVSRIKDCNSWHYDTSIYASTVVSEWDLVCSRRWLMSTTQASYMFGILVGAIVASAWSDNIGRRRVCLVCTLIMFLSSVGAAFSTSFEMFLSLRFFTAASGQGLYLSTYVLLMEVSGTNGRTVLSPLFAMFLAIGSATLPWIAYFYNSWRRLQLVTGAATGILFIYYWILPESPRWLFFKGRVEEGMKILKKMAKQNGGSLPEESHLDSYLRIISQETYNTGIQPKWKKITEFRRNLFFLLRTPIIRRRILIMCYFWFTVSCTVYGIIFSGHNINVSPYMFQTFMGVTWLLSLPTHVYTLKRLGRRLTSFTSFLLSGLACLSIIFIPKELSSVNMVVLVFGRLLSNLSFRTAFLYSCELVPTSVRALSLGFGSLWGRVGSMLSPFIVDFLGEIYYAIPSTVFGALALVAGCLTLLLPETSLTPLPESIEEIEALPK